MTDETNSELKTAGTQEKQVCPARVKRAKYLKWRKKLIKERKAKYLAWKKMTPEAKKAKFQEWKNLLTEKKAKYLEWKKSKVSETPEEKTV